MQLFFNINTFFIQFYFLFSLFFSIFAMCLIIMVFRKYTQKVKTPIFLLCHLIEGKKKGMVSIPSPIIYANVYCPFL